MFAAIYNRFFFSPVVDVGSILENTTALNYTQTLISHEMEQYTHFMLTNVHVAPNFPTRRYQEMFIVSPAVFSLQRFPCSTRLR